MNSGRKGLDAVPMEQIILKTRDEINAMRRGGALLRTIMETITSHVRPGITTLELDQIAKSELDKANAIPAFLGLYGFPGTLCISVNEQVVHGIPGKFALSEGDIVSLDIGLVKDGFYVDMARTVPVGRVSEDSQHLIEAIGEALEVGIDYLRPGRRLGDLSAAIQQHVESRGLSVVREYTGHGIGRKLHEEPKIPNFGEPGKGVRWRPGMVVCLEPMVNAGTHMTRTLKDKWTVVTTDGRRSAHMEHTVAVTNNGPLVLTEV